jgi:23S rRNA (uridine2552-2'-O)-methyltransferase
LARSKSSHRWLSRQHQDPYVQRAQQQGYRSRSAFKLIEIQTRDRLLRSGQRILDLGAAPGGWSQVARDIIGDRGHLIALDLLPMDPLPGVEFIQGDFRDETPLAQLIAALGGEPVDLVLSDMAPNLSGMSAVDQPRSFYLAELALELCAKVMKPGGSLLVKVFQGEGFDAYLRELRAGFRRVASRKPQASRPESREIYLLAQGYNLK